MRKEEKKSVGKKGMVWGFLFWQKSTSSRQPKTIRDANVPKGILKNKSTKFAISQQKALNSQYLNIAL